MKNKDIKEAKRLWEELCKSVSKKRNPFVGMTKEEAIEAIRKVREKLWEEKFAARH
jgi:low affinity Fe/Cu permease